MKIHIPEIFVDGGQIGIFSLEFLKKYKYKKSEFHTLIDVKKGDYEVQAIIPGSHRGRLEVPTIIKNTEKIVVGDPCYGFSTQPDDTRRYKMWVKIWSATEGFTDIPEGCGVNMVTGGDGKFEMTLYLKRKYKTMKLV